MRAEISHDADIMCVCISGSFSLEPAKRVFREKMDAVRRSQTAKVLVDKRKLSGSVETMEWFYYGEHAAGVVLDSLLNGTIRCPKFAYVYSDVMFDHGLFFENVAVNRGMNVKTFRQMEDAIQWLGAED